MCLHEDVWDDRNIISELGETTLDGEPAYEFRFGSSGICHKKSEFSIEPKVGDQLDLATYSGSACRGMRLNGAVMFYYDDATLQQQREEWSKHYHEKQQKEFDEYMQTAGEKYAALPKCLQKRIDAMRVSDDADTRYWEPYTMFAFQEGVKIAAILTSEKEILAFRELSWKNQKTLVPDLSEDHSGGTFATAIVAALEIIKTPE